jgi:hypothetical protein
MAESAVYPKVILKKKQIPTLIEFCLEESIEFSVKQQSFPDTDWEVELKIKDVKTGIVVGMFLRDNRFELDGLDQQRVKKPVSKKSEDKHDESEGKSKSKSAAITPEPEDEGPTLM